MFPQSESTAPAPEAAAPATTAPAALARPWYRRPVPLTCIAAGLALVGVLSIAGPLAASAAASSAATTAASTSDAAGSMPSVTNPYSGAQAYGGYGPGSTQNGGTSGGTGTTTGSANEDATTASADESTGVVLIDTVIGYENSAAAGTGLVLTSDGLVLTNNHVIADSTEISVTLSTGETYTATVVGTDVADDVALLQLQGASGLDTVTIDDDAESVGDAVTAVGNAEGGGVLLAADGEITQLDATVTTSGSDSETLDGMIQFSADVVAGDSGGALLDAEGEVIGVTTAASSGTATTTAFAIPIEDALAIVDQILAGDESDGVTLRYPAFLGVEMSSGTTSTYATPGRRSSSSSTTATTSGAVVAGVIDGMPAASAGLTAGDTITAVDGTSVASSTELSAALSGYDPGDTVTITWTDASGASHSASVTLATGPAA